MYTAQALDLVNGLVCNFNYSHEIGEAALGRKLAEGLEKQSITLYDRLYDSYSTALTHSKAQNYFFVRVKAKNPKSQQSITEFCRSNRRHASITLHPPRGSSNLPQLPVRLIKIRNPRSNEDLVFMTNLPENLIKRKEMGAFYQRRWGIESSFKDITDTLKMCQWHSLKMNGILQEIYATLWLVNQVRHLCALTPQKTKTWLNSSYQKSNFKLIVRLLVDHIDLLIKQKHRKMRQILSYWIKRTTENREHLSRSYPRQLRKCGKTYINAAVITRA
jgi:DDE family transposase